MSVCKSYQCECAIHLIVHTSASVSDLNNYVHSVLRYFGICKKQSSGHLTMQRALTWHFKTKSLVMVTSACIIGSAFVLHAPIAVQCQKCG